MIVFYHLPKEQQSWVRKQYPHLKYKFNNSTPIHSKPPRDTEVLSIHSNCIITSELLRDMPQLKLIVTRTTGIDHIDITACKNRGVLVANAAGMNARSVAEFTFGLLLNAARLITTGNNRVIAGVFSDAGMVGTELQGKTMGVIGTGAIGSSVLELAKAFGMELLAYDFKKNTHAQKKIGFKYVLLKQVFEKADVVSLHVPGTPLTEHMVNREMLNRMKPGSGIVNTARGSVVDAKAVLGALQQKKLAWYAADVLEDEHSLSPTAPRSLSAKQKALRKINQSLIRHPRALITPHMAHATTAAAERVLVQSMEHIQNYLNKKPFPTIV